MLEHIPHVDAVIEEIARMVRPGRRFIVLYPIAVSTALVGHADLPRIGMKAQPIGIHTALQPHLAPPALSFLIKIRNEHMTRTG